MRLINLFELWRLNETCILTEKKKNKDFKDKTKTGFQFEF